jgi:hypothetical protein
MVAWAQAAREGMTMGKTRGATTSLAPVRLAVAPAAPAVEGNRRVEAF